jgi:hypothetical protein
VGLFSSDYCECKYMEWVSLHSMVSFKSLTELKKGYKSLREWHPRWAFSTLTVNERLPRRFFDAGLQGPWCNEMIIKYSVQEASGWVWIRLIGH